MVLAQVQKRKDIRVPWFEVNSNASLALAASLVHVAGRVVEDAEHGNDSVRRSVGSANVGLTGTNVVNVETDSSGILGDDCTILEGFVDSVNAVFLHGEEKARRHLRHGGSSVEESGCGVGEVTLGQEVVRLNGPGDVAAVDSKSHTHEHELRALGNLAVHFQEVRLFQCFESKVVVFKVASMNDGPVKLVFVLLHNFVDFVRNERSGETGLGVLVVVELFHENGELINGLLVKIRHRDPGGQNRVVRVLGGERSCGLGSESVEKRAS